MMLHHTTSHLGVGPHIADVNILLPPKMTHPVEYRLQGSDGCFKWSWDHHDILSVLPEFNSSSHCSMSARLKSIAPFGGRKETAVYATDLNTGMVIRCKVYIDMVSRIQIFHNSVKLDLDGLATLRVRAFDSEENVFSSLVGLQFMWKLMPETPGSPHNLVHVPLKDSPLSDCGGLCGDLDIPVKLEESGVFSILVRFKLFSCSNGQALGTVHALDLGATTIVVEDTRVVGHMQISSLHVVLPDNLLLFLSPLSPSGGHIEGVKPISSVSRWYVVAGRLYLVHVKEEFWNILPVSEGLTTKNNYRLLSANSYGLGKLTASLAYSTGHDVRKEVLKVVQEVMVCDQVKFIMEGDSSISHRVLLPWVPGVYQELELKASGGCAMSSSDYKWFSSDMTVASVSVSGIVQAKRPGKTTITAVSIFDSLNYDEIVVEVSIPSSMSSIRWKTESESFLIVNSTADFFASEKQEAVHSSSFGPPCAWTHIYASNTGRTVVHATLTRESQQYDHSSSGSIVLKASLSIAAYSPLIVHQASDGNQFGGYWFDLARRESQHQLNNLDNIYLAPGTHLDIMLQGGPERWGKDVEFIETVEVLDEQISYVKDGIFIDQMSTNYADEALNTPSVIQLAARADRTPGRIRTSPVTVANGRRIRMSAVGLSDSGKAFANSSSLSLKWELTECEGLALLDDAYTSAAYSSWERFFILQNRSGVCIVRSTVVGLTDSLSHSDFATMFELLRILLPMLSSCSLFLLLDLGSALVTVQDIGLVPPLAASSMVQVAEMDWIKILTGERISIEEGSFQSINFLVGVADGRIFDPSQYIYMRVRVHIAESIVEVVENYDFPIPTDGFVHAPNFTLQARRLGVTNIYLSAIQHSGIEIMSQIVNVEVYAPPRIHPSNIFLVPGASYVLTVRGGPEIGSRVQYASMDDQTVNIHKFSGRVSAISPGNSTLVATIYGDGDILLCRAYGKVRVGIPSSAVLNAQSEQLAVGRRMPIHPSLSDGNLFSFYQLCNNFKWAVEDKGAELGLQIKYHDSLGNPFHEAHNITLFEVETNYADIVSIDKGDGHGNIHLRAKSQGMALAQIAFVSNPQKSVYAVICVGPQLYPQNPVIHKGSGLNFNIKGLSDSASGQWFSANESILYCIERECRVVDAPREILTNVPFPAKGYAFSVKFSDAHNHSHEASGNNMLFLFDCEVDPPNIGFANPGRILALVLVSVRASLRGDHHISGSASALFIGGFTILGMDKNLLRLNLTRDSSESVVTIIGNRDVEVNWHDKNRLSVRPIHGADPAVGKYVQYEVKVRGAERFQDELTFSLPATGQSVGIDISYDPEERKQ
ncbi:UNVERIFIED_CONTAM: Nuclear pore complex protein [Sesamum radiatum]|uniref:Nuclear pore complex protein n=1 Tax=Sesamum radiatum TaxID=300843 RepID=A0AAW2P6G1_SESRA